MSGMIFLFVSLASAGLGLQEDVQDARIGELNPIRSPEAEVIVHASPDLRKAVSSYFLRGRESFRLENGVVETEVAKWVGWKMPEGKSVLLARSPGGLERLRLLIGGVEEKRFGDVFDAALLDDGQQLAWVTKSSGGMVLTAGDLKVGPHESIHGLALLEGKLRYVTVEAGKSRLHCLGREFALEGAPVLFATAGEPARVAWVERLADGKQRAVVEGKPGPPCDGISGVHFSPKGNHVAYVTREGHRYRAWIDGNEVRSARSVVAARVFDDGLVVQVELVKEVEPRMPSPATPSAPPGKDLIPDQTTPREVPVQIVVRGQAQEQVLKSPVTDFEFAGGELHGVGRFGEESVLVRVSKAGEVRYDVVPGRVGTVLRSPDGKRHAYSIRGREGQFAVIDGKRSGPFSKVELFYLDFTQRMGFVSLKDGRVQVTVEDKVTDVALGDFSLPLRIAKSQLTMGLVGTQTVRNKAEIWVRAVPLE